MIRVLIAGLGNMGLSHALAHHHHPDAEIVGLVNRSGKVDHPDLAAYPAFDDFETALTQTKPDLAVIATYTDTHANYAVAAMGEKGIAHLIHILTEDLISCMGQMGISALDDAAAQLIAPGTGK